MLSAIPARAVSMRDSAWTPCSKADFSRFCVSKEERIESAIAFCRIASAKPTRCAATLLEGILLLLVCLHMQVDLHVVSDDLGAFDHLIPAQTELAALKVGFSLPPGYSLSLHPSPFPQNLSIHNNLLL